MRIAALLVLTTFLAACAALPAPRVKPSLPETHNAEGMRLAAAGRHDAAIAEFERAIALAPGRAYLHNNLGYAFLLRGSLERAIGAFEAARHLDPQHAAARRNLETARAMLPRPAARAEERPAPVPAAAPARAQAASPGMTLVPLSPQVYELRLPAAAPVTPVKPAPARKVRLDVANGNGVRGFARRAATRLAAEGLPAVRVSNAAPYRQATSVVRYRPGYRDEAQRVARLVPGAHAEPSGTLPAGIDVRLVLGRDRATLAMLRL